VRYFLVKFSRGKVIAFDIAEALSFEGETGPYLQYAVVRATNILAKLAERDRVNESGLVSRVADWPYSSFHQYVTRGSLPSDWGGDVREIAGKFGE